MVIFLLVFIVVVVIAYVLCLIAPKVGLLAFPGDHRQHEVPTAMVGGIAIFFGISVGVILFEQSYFNLVPSLFVLCLVGSLDDRYKLSSWSRILAQILAVYLMIELTEVRIENLGELFTDSDIKIGMWSNALTIFATIGVINAINMSDGVDGLAGLLTILVLTTILYVSDQHNVFLVVVIAAISGFLFWNLRLFRPNAKIFMGDAGSTMLGFLLAYVLIQASQNTHTTHNNIQPVTALWILALPLFDAVAVMMVRPIRGFSPFKADRIHYHHLLQARSVSVNLSLTIILLLQFILILIGLIMLRYEVTESIQLIIFILFFVGYLLTLTWETRDNRKSN